MPSRLIWIGICVALVACNTDQVAGGAGAGNPPQAKVSISLKAELATGLAKKALANQNGDDEGDGPKISDSLGSSVTLTGITAQVQSIEFHFHESFNCENVTSLNCDADKIAIDQKRDVDLLAGTLTPPLAPLDLPAGAYPKVRLQFVTNPSGHSGGSEENANVWLRGFVTAKGQADRPFEFSFSINEGMDFETGTGIEFKPHVTNTLQLIWQVNHWFDDVDMLHCLSESKPVDSTGLVQLQGDEACGEVGKQIRQRIEASGKAENSQ